MKKYLVLDVETSGISNNPLSPCENMQIVSIGMIVVDQQLNEIDKLYVPIKWNGESEWQAAAEKIHGLSKEYLQEHGVDEILALEEIAVFLDTHFDKEPITLMGTNVMTFDRLFLMQLLKKYDIYFKFDHRGLDTTTLAFLFDCNNSKDFLALMGMERQSEKHNALEDAGFVLKIFKIVKEITNEVGN